MKVRNRKHQLNTCRAGYKSPTLSKEQLKASDVREKFIEKFRVTNPERYAEVMAEMEIYRIESDAEVEKWWQAKILRKTLRGQIRKVK